MLRGRAARAVILGITALFGQMISSAEAGDWQLWIPPPGTADNPPPYDQWEQVQDSEFDGESRDSCLRYAAVAALLAFTKDDNEMTLRVTNGICFNVATREIAPTKGDPAANSSGDWQIWIAPPGMAANPPSYDQWLRYEFDDNWDSLETCLNGVNAASLAEFARGAADTADRLLAGICFNAVTKDIYSVK